ncbi:hypothetical protein [Phycicoccus sp. Root563]|uniref:hypothetical protein n=1 Tax=Phycicoccus sp. Root563 TaxID=1736562 RepID=UPI0007035206|nr:hypothetical protein [Phycicoccus sp. Root563]KQZ89453.1 hypothetical protein ASD62_09195 [Phycicoccus sp. Root563]
MNTSTKSAAVVLGVALVATVGAQPASAKGLDVRASGTCSKGSVWKLKAKADDGRIQTELEVDSNRVGQAWSVRLSDNGVLLWSGKRTTVAPSGSFTLGRLVANRAGTDRIRATATTTSTGETCSAVVVFPG